MAIRKIDESAGQPASAPSPEWEAPDAPLGVGERIEAASKKRGFRSIAALARFMGLEPGAVRLHVHRNSIPSEHIVAYTKALAVSVEWLLQGRGSGLDIAPPDDHSSAVKAANRSLDPARSASLMRSNAEARAAQARVTDLGDAAVPPHHWSDIVGGRDLPVYGSAHGGNGMTVDPHPIEYVKRPAPLLSVAKGFAVYVVGDSMSPAYEQGDMVLVHPGLPVGRGDDALLASVPKDGGDWTAIVKRITGMTEKIWKLQQFNPRREFDVPRADYPQAYRIVGKYNRR